MTAVRGAAPEDVERRLVALVRERPEVANEVVAVGIPILLPGLEVIRGTRVIVPADADRVPVASETLERWVEDGWVDLRRDNCARWIARFQRMHEQVEALPRGDTSSAHLRTMRFWDQEKRIQPGKVVGWVLSEEEHGTRVKD